LAVVRHFWLRELTLSKRRGVTVTSIAETRMVSGRDAQDRSSRCAPHHECDGPIAGIASVNRSRRSVLLDGQVRPGRNDTRKGPGPDADQEHPMNSLAKRFVNDESGATAIEYGLIAAGISVAIIAVVNSLGSQLKATFTDVSSQLATTGK
jgi:pilus assembly protein Flp/PilA